MGIARVVIEDVKRDRFFFFAEPGDSCSGDISHVIAGNEVRVSLFNNERGNQYLDVLTLYDFDGNGTIDGYVYTYNNIGPRENEDGEFVWDTERGDTVYVTDGDYRSLIEYDEGALIKNVGRYQTAQMMDATREHLTRRCEEGIKYCDGGFSLDYIFTYGLAHFMDEPIRFWVD